MDNPWHIVEVIALAVWSAGFALVMKAFGNNDRRHGVTDRRLANLEQHQYTREDAERGRAELKKELKHDIEAVSNSLHVHRAETNTQFERVFDRLDTIVDRLPAKGQ